MKKVDFSTGWRYKHLDRDEAFQEITIPHDAMFSEKRTAESLGGKNVAFFEGDDYLYQKEFELQQGWESKRLVLEFEGVYHNAEVYLNGKKLYFRPYGYTNFFVDITEAILLGQKNRLDVIARNSDQPNSRWYSGAGIYRPVQLYIGGKDYILEQGIRLTTLSIEPARVQIELTANHEGVAVATIAYKGQLVCERSIFLDESGYGQAIVELNDALLWSAEAPNLYTVTIQFGDDCVTEQFGIRTLNWDIEHGLTINGQREILRGACIHHDNGLLGACAFPEAEERKIQLLKKNGYNAIRSAHNPCSKALLEACNRLGMYVMDEYLDVWYIHKTDNDYAHYMSEWWSEDLKDMVYKDYNHPSVIMYSTGNEVSETAQPRGIQLTKEMTDYLHQLDATRPVTCGVNIFFNFLSSIGLGIYSDEKAKKEVANRKKKAPVGSEFYNTLAGLTGAEFMKRGATLHACDVKTRDAFANMDIAGYNYGILRYQKDLKKYPNRFILGTETFCSDAYSFWEMAKKHPRIIGDFVWAGMDYMGETGVGAWEYEDYYPKSAPKEGWLTAGSGRLNILGRPLAEASYTKVAFEVLKQPVLAVRPVYQTGKHSPSAWKMTDALHSWTYPGCEGMRATVEVYARAARAELYINSRLVGRKTFKNDCKVIFHTRYEPGELKVLTYNQQNQLIGQTHLLTAEDETLIKIEPETGAQAGKLLFVPIRYTDSTGILKPMHRGRLKISVLGGELVGFGHACPYNREGYLLDESDTYYGEAMAIVRPNQAEQLTLSVTDGTLSAQLVLPIM
ncbi:glycoside hydrolase family 2 TIM barrel-domain containing protein [Streptococcus sp. ZJ93]|uniref:glycoside hydrolase family 2 TIM barrel-domain containing protein n=1 Tax=Streptococcus handemini TaxID=3161188 RepID=UPI0032EDF7CA